MTLPFMLMFIFRGNWKIVLASAAFMVTSTIVLCLWVHSSPLGMIPLWLRAAEGNAGAGYDFSSLLIIARVDRVLATRLAEVFVLAAAVAVFIFLRNLTLLALFGVAAGFGRLWTYHRVYDNVMLAILLIALAAVASKTRRASTLIALALLGLTLWFPLHSVDVPIIHITHVLIWMAAMAALCRDAIDIQRRERIPHQEIGI